MTQTLERIGELGLVPVIKIERAVRLGEAVLAGGLPCVEITFRTEAAEEVIRSIAAAFPDSIVGAGTVLSVDQAQRAVGAGAQFIVAPGFNPKVVDWLAPAKLIAAEAFDEITRRVQEAVTIVRQCREGGEP